MCCARAPAGKTWNSGTEVTVNGCVPSEHAGGPPIPGKSQHHSRPEDAAGGLPPARQQVPPSGAAPPLFWAARLITEDKVWSDPAGDSWPDERGEIPPRENAVAGINWHVPAKTRLALLGWIWRVLDQRGQNQDWIGKNAFTWGCLRRAWDSTPWQGPQRTGQIHC